MSLEDRVRSSVDQALASLVKQVVEQADEEREAAIRAARESALAEAEQAAQARVADAEASVRAGLDAAIATARAEDREVAAREIRRQVEAEVELKMLDEMALAETRMREALADSEARAAVALKEAVSAAHERERDAEMAHVTRLLESIRGLDGATSLSEVLDALALAAAREAARAAVVVLRADRVLGWKVSGFGSRDTHPKSIDLAVNESGVIGMAIGSARAVNTRDGHGAGSGPGFETLPADRLGLAVPVIVGGRVVAVVYADSVTQDGQERAVPSGWPELIEVLARHAGRCLEALTTQRTAPPPRTPTTAGQGGHAAGPVGGTHPAGAMSQITDGVFDGAKRTARLLVSEIRLFHETAVHEGRRGGNLLERLAPEIEKAPDRLRPTRACRRAQQHRLFSPGTGPHPRGWRRDSARKHGIGEVHTKVLTAVHSRIRIAVLGVTLVSGLTLVAQQRLAPTAHPPVPLDLSSMWFATAAGTSMGPALTNFVKGVRLLEDSDNAAAALPLVSTPALANTALGDYARYYTGMSLTKLSRYEAADTVFGELAARQIDGHLPEDAALRQAEVREAQKNFKGAVAVYESLVGRKLARPQVAWLKLGLAADQAGQPMRSIEALQRVYYDFPTSTEAAIAAAQLDKQDVEADAALAPKELARAEALFVARRWPAARDSYEAVRPFVTGTERARVEMRLAACDVGQGRFREGRDRLAPLLDGPAGEEASFHNLVAVRGLKLADEHVKLSRAFVAKYPASPFADEALNNLASAYIIDDEDERADAVFREVVEKYPAGRFAERAAWKAGWWSYRQGRFQEAATFFDRGAAQFPRSDYRPSWLYWSGRASLENGNVETGIARLRLTATDYHNSYYGRLAVKNLASRRGGAISASLQRQPAQASVPTAQRIAMLLAAGLNEEAMSELQYAQRVWGDSPQLQATIALTHRRLGNVRAGINAMKRAYPQYLASGGETLPKEILQVIFPLDYWPLLQKYAVQRGLDPYVVAALVAQESNFDPVIISHANAIGLMQVMPTTGRGLARKLGVRPYSTKRLQEAEVNVRLGTQFFADSIRRFGGVHFALAAYNAGDSRVASWQRERPGMPQDEFIDDIPFPETQNYVKRILGTAEDYRYLYSK